MQNYVCCSVICRGPLTLSPTVQTNPNYHQGTPGPPEWAGIIDLMMLSPAKKPIPKTFLKKELCLFKNHEKSKKARFYGDFHFFRDFRINVTLFSEKFFGIGFFSWTKHH